jgi:prepilin-type N-terminal cleavage/methylation domain-containing protein
MVLTAGRPMGGSPVDAAPAKGRAGFTLVEVMAAMTLLTIGVLGAQAVSLAVARSVAHAEWKNRGVAMATTAMEQARLEAMLEGAPGADRISPRRVCRRERDLEVCVETGVPPHQGVRSSTSFTAVLVTVARPGAEEVLFWIRSDVFPPAR